MTRGSRRTRAKPRKRRAQERPATREASAAATEDRARKTAKRRRRTAEDTRAAQALPKTPHAAARVRGRSTQKSRKPARARRGR